MKKLAKPIFEDHTHGAGGGLPIIKSIWEKFGFSYLFLSIDKHSGLAPWKLVFAYIAGLISNSSSVNKIELAKDMLLSLREVTSVRLWVAMDRWFLCKDLFQWLNSKNFHWVTKCKRNTALYQLSGSDWKGNPRYSPIKPGQLLALNYLQLIYLVLKKF